MGARPPHPYLSSLGPPRRSRPQELLPTFRFIKPETRRSLGNSLTNHPFGLTFHQSCLAGHFIMVSFYITNPCETNDPLVSRELLLSPSSPAWGNDLALRITRDFQSRPDNFVSMEDLYAGCARC